MSLDLIYSYLNSNGKDINRLTKYYKNGIINTSLSYDGYNPFPYLITKKNLLKKPGMK